MTPICEKWLHRKSSLKQEKKKISSNYTLTTTSFQITVQFISVQLK